MLNNLSGIGAVQEALNTTNALLADVLAELKEDQHRSSSKRSPPSCAS